MAAPKKGYVCYGCMGRHTTLTERKACINRAVAAQMQRQQINDEVQDVDFSE